MIRMKEIFPGVFRIDDRTATRNLVPGYSVYGERFHWEGNVEYRFWDPYRSKLGAAIAKGLKNLPIKEGDAVLYLGAAQGTTPSHISDLVGESGIVFCIDMAPKAFEKLTEVCERRQNMIPILADARMPEQYADMVESLVDVIYQDVAQPDQAEILLRNARRYLKKGGYAVIAIKARSIDVSKDPKEVFKEETGKLEKEMRVLEAVGLNPFEKDHALIVLQATTGP